MQCIFEGITGGKSERGAPLSATFGAFGRSKAQRTAGWQKPTAAEEKQLNF
jgi:hypothetical protein